MKISLFSDHDFSKASKGYTLYLLNEDPECQAVIKSISLKLVREDFEYRQAMQKELHVVTKEEIEKEIEKSYETKYFKNAVETVLLTSDLKPIKRIATTETVLGLNDMIDYEDEERELTIPEKITELNEKISYFESSRLIVPANIEPEINQDLLIQNTTLTQKANAIYEYLKEKVKPNWSGKTVIANEGIYSFFFEVIEEKLRWPEKLRGKRTAKKSTIERAVELHPDELEIVKNKSGNKITGLALKPSSKRIDTYAY